jgi:hypothetical protein
MDLKYPNDLAELVAKQWSELQSPASSPSTALVSKAPGRHVILRGAESSLPDPDILRQLMGTLYHVSLLTEESRKLAVRISFLMPEDFNNRGPGDQVIHDPPVAFSTPREFTVSEVMRLAPALDPTQSVLVVCPSDVLKFDSRSSLAVWGIMHLGEDWWRFTSGRGSGALVPPRCLTLSTFAPGTITATVAGMVIARLEGGEISGAPAQGLMAGAIGRFLESGADRLYQDTVKRLGLQRFSQRPDEESLPARLFYKIFENILRFAAEHRHGAAFAILPDGIAADDARLRDRIKMKYAVESPNIWSELVDECVAYRRYFDLVSKKDNAPAAELKEMNIWEKIWEDKQRRITALESFVASLSGVDGIVVLSKGCRLLGFGGEITVPMLDLAEVKRAEDANATKLTTVQTDSFGTRHRSAFRLCSSFEDCVVLIVSQDGAARAVKKVGQDVVLWNSVDLRPFAL